MKKLILSLLVVLAAFAVSADLSAQGRRGLRINEVMVVNDSSVVDDFGRHAAWIELFNSTYAPMEISSIFIETDQGRYPVPMGDVNTKIPKRQHILFWADGRPADGTFHMNLTLEPGRDNVIRLIDADGLTLIDSVVVPASLAANQTYARVADGNRELGWEVRDGVTKVITPSSNNVIKDSNGKVEMFRERDAHGFALTVMAMCIVFGALLLLAVCFSIISAIGARRLKSNKMRSQGQNPREISREDHPEHDSGEVIAAITMALHEHLDAHDRESTVLTINKVRRAYSPWNSKLYGMRQLPSRR
ncbi:MAG: OadG family protein [Clostridium sp.]|nr:OadG family protein [Clostridium sp.]